MKNVKRLLTLLMAAAMLLGLAACGETNVEETAPPEFVYKANYQKVEGTTEETSYLYPSLVTEDGFYCMVSEKTGERELMEGETLEWDGQLDVYESFLYRLGIDGTLSKMEGYKPTKLEAEEGHSISGGTNYIARTADGGFLTIDTFYESWSNAGDDVERDSEEWYMSMEYAERYFIRTLDKDGKEISNVELDVEELKQNTDYVYFNGIAEAKDNQALLAGNSGLYIFDTQTGKMTGTIEGVDWLENMLTLRDGRVAVINYGDSGQQISIVDLDKGKIGDAYPVQGDLYRAVVGGGDYDFYYNNGVNFFGYNLETGVAEKLFNWINCDVDNSNISGFTVTEDGRIIAVSTEWDQKSESYDTQLITMEKVSSDTLPKKETITLACQYLDWYARKQLIDFNRSHDDVRIELHDYSEYNTEDDYEAGTTKLRTEMLAGNCPDIIFLSGMPAKQLAAKGLLADLYPLIDADPELSREDFFPSVLSTMENNGKLFSTVSSFEVITAVGSSQVVGSEPGWSYQELMDALKEMPEGTTVFSTGETRYDVLQQCLMLDMDHYVDWNTGKVSFDTPEFVEMLNFVKNFPAEFDWENYEWSEEDDEYNRVREGRQLLIYSDLYNFDSISQYENIFGGLDAFTFIGFPTAEGVGNMIMTESGYGICEKSKNKEAAWEFIRIFMTEEFQDNNVWSFPSNIHSYEAKKANAMTPTYLKDENGKIMVDPETGEKLMEEKGGYWDNEKEEWVSIYSYSKEEIGKIESVINSTTRVYALDEAISDIVKEQVEAFFAGQRSAEDVAKLIQSKAMIYVNEQK